MFPCLMFWKLPCRVNSCCSSGRYHRCACCCYCSYCYPQALGLGLCLFLMRRESKFHGYCHEPRIETLHTPNPKPETLNPTNPKSPPICKSRKKPQKSNKPKSYAYKPCNISSPRNRKPGKRPGVQTGLFRELNNSNPKPRINEPLFLIGISTLRRF